MAVKTVTLTTDAYDALAAAKREGESFSEVVRRLAGPKVRLTDFAGAWSKLPKHRLREIRAGLKAMDEESISKLKSLGRRAARGEP